MVLYILNVCQFAKKIWKVCYLRYQGPNVWTLRELQVWGKHTHCMHTKIPGRQTQQTTRRADWPAWNKQTETIQSFAMFGLAWLACWNAEWCMRLLLQLRTSPTSSNIIITGRRLLYINCSLVQGYYIHYLLGYSVNWRW